MHNRKLNTCQTGFAIAAAWLLQSCATGPALVVAPVGPAPVTQQARISEGALVVYSATEDAQVGDGLTYRPHSGYTIHLEDGKRFKYIPNHTGLMDEKPEVVLLPVGTYKVIAQAEGYGRVTVPVVVTPRKLTELHLDGDQNPQLKTADNNSVVRLPNGRVIGWRAGVLPSN